MGRQVIQKTEENIVSQRKSKDLEGGEMGLAGAIVVGGAESPWEQRRER